MIYVFIAGVLWGTIGIFVNELTALGVSGSQISIMRMIFALIAMLIISLLKDGRKIFSPSLPAIIVSVILGIVSHGMFNICYTASIRINGMGIASILLYSAPVFTCLGSRIIYGEKLTVQKIIALCINILGCVLTVTGGRINADTLKLTGIVSGLGSGFCYGMAAIIGRKGQEYTDAISLSVYSYISAVIFLLIFMMPGKSAVNIGPKILLLGILYGVIPTAGAYMIYYIGLQKITDTSRVPVIASVEPVLAVILGRIIYGAEMLLMNYIGIVFVLISIIIMMKPEGAKKDVKDSSSSI